MKYETNNKLYHDVLPKRKNTLLDGYDYSRTSFHHVILHTYKNQYLFGKYVHSCVNLNTLGLYLSEVLMDDQNYWTNGKHAFIIKHAVMPDHVHLLIYFRHLDEEYDLTKYISSLKLHCVNKIIQKIKSDNLPRYEGHVWQSKYIERYIRDEDDYIKCFRYIHNNPNNLFYRRIEEEIYIPITTDEEKKRNAAIETEWEKLTEGMKTISYGIPPWNFWDKECDIP